MIINFYLERNAQMWYNFNIRGDFMSEKFSIRDYSVEQILGLIRSKRIAIPEIQRPFVWKNTQVRDLLDSLYKGYPTGYIILWQNHGVK